MQVQADALGELNWRNMLQRPIDETVHRKQTDGTEILISATMNMFTMNNQNVPLFQEKHVFTGNIEKQNYLPLTYSHGTRRLEMDSRMVLEYKIDEYDSKGNILQYTNKDGVPTSFVWGYNYIYPVAKIVGASFSDIKAILSENSNNLTSVQNLTDNLLKNKRNYHTPKRRWVI